MSENQTEFSGWARVEILGHQTHIGEVSTQAFGGTVLFRVDQPAVPGVEEALERSEWVGDMRAPAGSVIKRADIPAATVLIGAGSIYRIIPCDEAAALAAIKASVQRPLIIVKLAEAKALTNGSCDEEEEDDEDDLSARMSSAPF